MAVSWLVLGVMLATSAAVIGAAEMRITPKRASTHRGGSVDLMCDAQHRVDDCTFNVWFVYYNGTKKAGQPISLERGKASVTSGWPNDDTALFNVTYHGEGLELGQCGLRMSGLTPGLYLVGCRVRTATSGWTYDHMALVVHDSAETPKTNSSSETDIEMVNVQRRKNKTIYFKVNETWVLCQIFTPDKDFPLVLTKNKATADIGHAASWSVSANTISVTLRNVTSGGVVWCLCQPSDTAEFKEFDMKIVTVLRPPANPELEVARTNLNLGDNLTATCVAKYARPVAKIVWKLGDEVIRNDTVDDNADDTRLDVDETDASEPSHGQWPWRWPWSTKSIKQVLNFPTLNLTYNGENLTCQVSHPALANGPLESSRTTITVIPGQSTLTDSKTFLIIVVILGVVLVAAIVGAAIFWMRRKRRAAFPAAEAVPSDRTSFVVDNDLYQSHTDARVANAQAPGSRRSYQAENPYEELMTAPTVGHPPEAPSARQTAIYGNTVQYEEVIVGPSAGSKPPPRKPVDPEACVYAEVMHKDRPKR